MLEKNLAVLKEKFPDIYEKILNTDIYRNFERTGSTVKIDGKTLFSKYNPKLEAEKVFEKWVSEYGGKDTVVFIGVANPFVIKEFLSKGARISAFVTDFEIFKIALSLFDYSDILTNIERMNELKEGIPEDCVFVTKAEKKNLKKGIANKSYMKILLVKPIYGGSLPVANYCELNLKNSNVKLKTIDSNRCFNAFQMIPDTLVKKENVSRIRAFLADFISELTCCAIEEFKPDVIFALAQAPLNERVLKYASEKGIVKAFWFVEDWKLFTYWKYFAPFYDYFFVIQQDEFFKKLGSIGVKNFHYLPLACEPTVHKPIDVSEEDKKRYGSTLSFVGAGYYNRRKFFRKFLNYDFKIWGSDWDGEINLSKLIQERGRRVSTEESVKIFNSSLININLHSSTYYEGIAPDGDFVNPRTFEIAACNSYQLVDRRKYLPLHFKEGDEILTYSSERELKDYISDIMDNPKKYEGVKNASYKRVLQEHTYFHRMSTVSTILGYTFEKKRENYTSEKEYYLSEFNSIEEIAAHISKKPKVSETDTLFLLMKSLKDTYLK
jgi:spore maturation protein CgeB